MVPMGPNSISTISGMNRAGSKEKCRELDSLWLGPVLVLMERLSWKLSMAAWPPKIIRSYSRARYYPLAQISVVLDGFSSRTTPQYIFPNRLWIGSDATRFEYWPGHRLVLTWTPSKTCRESWFRMYMPAEDNSIMSKNWPLQYSPRGTTSTEKFAESWFTGCILTA